MNESKAEKKPLNAAEKAFISVISIPLAAMLAIGLVTVCVKFAQVCWRWIS